MARLRDAGMEEGRIGGGNFTYTGARIERLGATEYTLVTIAVDETGSVAGWENDLRSALVAAVESCKRSPRSDNLLVRVVTFGSQYRNGVNEMHGFKPLAEIDVAQYPDICPGGMTPLNDAVFSAVGAMNAYGKQLADQDFGVNAIAFVITDGYDNASVTSLAMIKEEIRKAIAGEQVESIVTVLIGVNATEYATALQAFKDEAGMTQFIDIGDATKGKLAKLAQFVSQSVSSQSQALGTGGPSQNIAAVI